MARNRASKCGCRTRIVSNVVQNLKQDCNGVCTNPIFESPDVLSIMAPLIYDEIGINLCTTIPLGVDIPTTYPTAVSAKAQVLGMDFTYGEDNVEIEEIPGRPNCYLVTLTNITVSFAVRLYDSACRLVGTVFPTAVYLPSDTEAETYDEDTNPAGVQLEIFAPYGISYEPGATPTPILNVIGFLTGNNFVQQGLNLYAMAKVLYFDLAEGTVSMGLTMVLQSLYFAGYGVPSEGKICTPKGSLEEADNSRCMNFVAGDLLNLAIRPLELSIGDCECQSQNMDSSCDSCENASSGSCGCQSCIVE